MTTKDENITTVLQIAERLPSNGKMALIATLLSVIDQTTLNLVTRQVETRYSTDMEL